MNRFSLLILTLVLWVSLIPLRGDGGHEAIPDVIKWSEGEPLWVAADVGIARDGAFRKGALGAYERSARRAAQANRHAQAKRGAAADECVAFTGTIPGHFKSTASFGELTAGAEVIVSGRVTAIREGFFGGMPGSLLRLSATYLKGAAAPDTYLFYPVARIKTAEGLICAKSMRSDAVAPSIGDRFLVFSMAAPPQLDGGVVLHVDDRRELVHESKSGRTAVPDALRPVGTGDQSFAAIESAVVEAVDRTSVR